MTTLVEISRALAAATARMKPGAPVSHVYRPLEYARVPHEMYLSRWGGGRNVTPVELDRDVAARIEVPCDEALRATVELLAPELVIGVGEYARKRAERALAGLRVTLGTILHPSPASPRANRGWAAEAEKQLVALGIRLP